MQIYIIIIINIFSIVHFKIKLAINYILLKLIIILTYIVKKKLIKIY